MTKTIYKGQFALDKWVDEQSMRASLGESERKHKIAAAQLLAKTKIDGKEFSKWNLATLIAPPTRTPRTITNDILNGPITINHRQGGKSSTRIISHTSSRSLTSVWIVRTFPSIQY